MKIKKVLLITCVFPPEPIVSANLSSDIAGALSKTYTVTVISPKSSRPFGFKFKSEPLHFNFEHIKAKSFTYPSSGIVGRFKESYSFGRYCYKYIADNHQNIDVIYANTWPLLGQYFAVKAASKFDIPIIIHIQDIYPESLINKMPFFKKAVLKLLLPIDRYSLRNATHIICISENMKEVLKSTREIPAQKFTVIPNWQNEEQFISYHRVKDINESGLKKIFTFMYLGNNGPLAGVDFLIKSFIKANIPNTKLIVAGTGSRTDACKKLVSDLGATNINFLSVPENMVPVIQDKADVMLLPVKKNGALSSIPSKLTAYMFSSKPILGSIDLESDTAKAIIQSDCGIVIEPDREELMIETMMKVSEWRTALLEKKGSNGFQYAMKYFSKESNLKKVIKIIESIN